MKKISLFLFAFLLISVVLIVHVTSRNKNMFHNCPPEGFLIPIEDPEQNKLKNRIQIPKNFEGMAFDTLLRLPVPSGVSKRRRSKWSSTGLAQVQAQEKRAVRVEGYIVATNRAHIESCNCYIPSDRDSHIWLAGSPNDSKAQAVITETTPRVRINHPGWTLEIQNKLIENHTKVRISGWIMLDPDCPECVGKKRGTLWEIHPVLKIEVQGADGWREL